MKKSKNLEFFVEDVAGPHEFTNFSSLPPAFPCLPPAFAPEGGCLELGPERCPRALDHTVLHHFSELN